MLKSIESTEFGRKCGSRGDAVDPSVFPPMPGKNGCGNVVLGGALASGAVVPSVPIRNALEALRPPVGVEQLPPLPGTAGLIAATVGQLTGWIKPGLSSGVSTRFTPFTRP